MAAIPQQAWQSLGNYSGVDLNQNVAPTNKISLEDTIDYAFQEFRLPADYVRGLDDEAKIPDATGFQFLAEIRAGTSERAAIDYRFDIFEIDTWVPLASGTVIGSHSDGSKIWYDVHFSAPIAIESSKVNSLYRFGILGRPSTTPALPTTISYNSETGTLTIDAEVFDVRLVANRPTDITVTGDRAIVTYFPDSDSVQFDWQYGAESIWYTVPNPLVLFDGRALVDTTPVVDASYCFRYLSGSADSGVDFLGNSYRSVLVKSDPNTLSTVYAPLTENFWLSKPNPSKFAVECLYFDVRDASGEASVTDKIVIDPITSGAYFHVYYSTEGDPGTTDEEWESKLWKNSARSYRMLKRETHVLPEPINAKYICIEFSHLQGQQYTPGPFVQDIRYKKHPKWVLDFFLVQAQSQNVSEDPFIARTVNVTFDTLDLAYNYYLDDLKAAPIYPSPVTSSNQTVDSFFADTGDLSDVVDQGTLIQIGRALKLYQAQPGFLGSLNSILGRYVNEIASQTSSISYPIENPNVGTLADTRSVSSLDRQAVVVEQGYPVMSFYVACRHKYRELKAAFEFDRAYFVGVRELAFVRDHYSTISDSPLYVEGTGDDTNVSIDDFEQVDGVWMVYDADEEGPIV